MAKIAWLAQKRSFGDISIKWFLSIYCSLSSCKVWKKSLEQILSTVWIILDNNWNIFVHLTQKVFFHKFHLSDFLCLLWPIMLQSLKKNLSCGSWDKSLHNFGAQQDHNCPSGQKKIFLEISFNWFFSTYWVLSYCKLKKKTSKRSWEILYSRNVHRHTHI